MRQLIRLSIVALILAAGLSFTVSAQNTDPQQREKELYEAIENQVNRLAEMLDLDDAQIFYVDSILVHDQTALQSELDELQKKKVSNIDIYMEAQYKWADQIYYSFQKVFREDQWAKYLKSGAERDKKTRDKKRAKSAK